MRAVRTELVVGEDALQIEYADEMSPLLTVLVLVPLEVEEAAVSLIFDSAWALQPALEYLELYLEIVRRGRA